MSQLERELASRPRCGLCAFFPITAVQKFDCPIRGKVVYRTMRPRRTRSTCLNPYICFHPTTEAAWQARLEILRDQQRRQSRDYWKKPGRLKTHRINNNRWRHNHRAEILDKQHVDYYLNPEPAKERAWFHHQIEYYNPLHNILKRLAYYRRRERQGHELLERDFPVQQDAPTEPYVLWDISEIVVGYSGSERETSDYGR